MDTEDEGCSKCEAQNSIGTRREQPWLELRDWWVASPSWIRLSPSDWRVPRNRLFMKCSLMREKKSILLIRTHRIHWSAEKKRRDLLDTSLKRNGENWPRFYEAAKVLRETGIRQPKESRREAIEEWRISSTMLQYAISPKVEHKSRIEAKPIQ
jgi:plasmid stability protein